ncbi:hypothetical protein BJ741DRAFT_584934 [Chytriomyces cf. hyalinus JEL632]|nr:hypothetical protein BJ741DRAFT_584934 [Chytriomyces cf. hyalinus JEL632]
MEPSNLEMISAYLCKNLQKDSLFYLLDWLCTWTSWSKQSALEVVTRYPRLPTPHGFIEQAVKLGWKKVVQILVDGGWDVSAIHGLLGKTIMSNDCEMVAILLQDGRVDLSVHDYMLCQSFASLEMAETLFADTRIPNSEFLVSISQGDVEGVTNYLALSEGNLSSSSITALCLFLAVSFNHSAILTVLLENEQFQRNSFEIRVLLGKRDIFHAFFNEDQYDLCTTNWFILQMLSNSKVRRAMGQHQKWEFLVKMAFLLESHVLLEYVLTQEGTGFNVNAPKAIRVAPLSVNQKVHQMLDDLASRELFQPLLDEEPRPLLSVLKDPSEPITNYVLSKEQKFFSRLLPPENF